MSQIQVEITDASEFHCFRLVFNPKSAPGQSIEIMLHAASLVDLIHECSVALCKWQSLTTVELLKKMTGLSEEDLRERGLIA
jgi:hypothetical protein